jgi:hypothetical protein
MIVDSLHLLLQEAFTTFLIHFDQITPLLMLGESQ